jgi:hypothetical protein
MKAGTAEILGMIERHDALQRRRVELQSGLAARQEDRVRALRSLGDLEGAASLDETGIPAGEVYGRRKR